MYTTFRKLLLFTVFAGYYAVAFSQANELMFVEYVDWDPGNGVGVKIYNPTSNSINLSSYTLNFYNNGGTSPSGSYTLSGTIAAGGTKIFGNTAYCNTNCSSTCDLTNSSSGVNENDVVALLKGGNFIDMIGLWGYDPGNSGWKVGGVSNAHFHHKMTRDATNCIRYTATDGTSANSWPNSTTTNLPGWTVTGVSCLSGGYSLNVSTSKPKILTPSKDSVVCQGTSVSFTADGTYKWSRKNGSGTTVLNSSTSTLSVTFTTSGTDTIIAEGSSCGASTYDTVIMLVGAPISFTFGPDSAFCKTVNKQLNTGITGATYLWQDNSTAANFQVTTAGTYWAKVTKNNCTAADTVAYAIQTPVKPYLGIDTSFCQGDSVIKSYSCTGCKYVWSTSQTTSSITIKQTGNYWLEVTDSVCKTYDTVQVTVKTLPSFSLGADTTVCLGDSVVKSYTCTGCTYLWSTSETTPSKILKQSGSYWLQVTDAGCKNRDTVNITSTTPPTVSLGLDTAFCAGDSIVALYSCVGCKYLWNTNDTISSKTIKAAGTYWLQASNGGCKGWDTVVVNQKSIPVFSLGKDTAVCSGKPVMLKIPLTGTQNLWSTGQTTDSISITTAGTYWARATQNNCSYRDSINISANPSPAQVLADTVFCEKDSVILNATTAGATYLWDNGSTLSTRTVDSAGVYTVMITVNSCATVDTSAVKQLLLPDVPALHDTTLCDGETVILSGFVPNAKNYAWGSGDITPSIVAKFSGTYTLTVSNQCGDTTAKSSVTFEDCSLPYIPNAFSPNGDDLNDYFSIDIRRTTAFEILIYNRWGELLFESDDPAFRWNGTFHGETVPPGVYFYILSSKLRGKNFNANGTVTLFR